MSRPHVIITESNDDTLKFTLNGVDVSIANSIRRLILSEIPTIVMKPDNCTIHTNTSRLNNEIIKQRLGCIPVFINDMNLAIDKFNVKIKIKNNGDEIIHVTSGDFKVFNNDKEITKESQRQIFPYNKITNSYITFIRLRPKLSNDLNGEEIDLECLLAIGTAKENSMYNVVSTCTYANTIDPVAVNKVWTTKKKELAEKGLNKHEIEYEHKNWLILDSKRHFLKDSFDFTIETLGVFSNQKLVLIACSILISKLKNIIDKISDVKVKQSDTTIANSFDIKLENEDYTIGKVIEFNLYDNYYLGDKSMTYVGFLKRHPHDNYSIIRVAFKEPSDTELVKRYLTNACEFGIAQYEAISSYFN